MDIIMDNLLRTKKFRYSNKIFKCDNFLGKGGFGSCYSFKSETSDRIAVKIIDKKKLKTESFSRESNIHRRLNHENVVRYFSKCEDRGFCYIIMELCDKSLQHIFEKENLLPLIKIQRYAHDILKGLCYIHKYNIIHRDIKLENILISSGDVAKIADFGLARNLEESNRRAFCGSYHYLAPEIVTSFMYSPASDIWSFGVILYRLITGNYPFFGEFEDLFYRIQNIIYHRSASLNMNQNGRRIIKLFMYIFRFQHKRLDASELLTRSFFTKPIASEDDESSKNLLKTDKLLNSCTITKSLPNNIKTILDEVFGMLIKNDVMEIDYAEEFVYMIAYLDYTASYGLIYYLSNDVCGFWHYDQSTLFRYNGIYYLYKYSDGRRCLMSKQTISKTKQIRFQTLLNELLSPESDIKKDDSVMPEPIFIDYWVQTVEYFIVILSNGVIHIDKFKSFRENTSDKYIISGRTGQLYLKVLRHDDMLLRPLSLYERDKFFSENPQILEILTKLKFKG